MIYVYRIAQRFGTYEVVGTIAVSAFKDSQDTSKKTLKDIAREKVEVELFTHLGPDALKRYMICDRPVITDSVVNFTGLKAYTPGKYEQEETVKQLIANAENLIARIQSNGETHESSNT